MTSRPLDFESSAYASSATSARSGAHGTACGVRRVEPRTGTGGVHAPRDERWLDEVDG